MKDNITVFSPVIYLVTDTNCNVTTDSNSEKSDGLRETTVLQKNNLESSHQIASDFDEEYTTTFESQKSSVDTASSKKNADIQYEAYNMTAIASLLATEVHEVGIANPSEHAFHNLFMKNKQATMNSLLKTFMDYYSLTKHTNVIVGILHILSHYNYDEVYPIGQSIAMNSLIFNNDEVVEYAIKCFENWNSKDGIEKLKAMRFNTNWLQDYVNQVIEEYEG